MGADYEQIDLQLTYHHGDDDGDYEGFDRFGRIIDQWWDGDGSTADIDRFHYAYDRNSNPTYRDIDSAIYPSDIKDQAYTYDGLDRLKTFDRGTLSGSTISGTPNREQDFTLDALGNWASFLEKTSGTIDLDQDRTHNDANEITGITETTGPSWIDPMTNASGNMTEGPAPGDETTKQKYIYDAWNRLVKVTDASDVSLGEYEYDGMNRRIVKKTYDGGTLDDTFDYYFNSSWQIVEVRLDGDVDPFKQYIWHAYYIDALAWMFYDENVDGTGLIWYTTHDAAFNRTTDVLDLNLGWGIAGLRYDYDASGQVIFLDGSFGAALSEYWGRDGESYFSGYRRDPESGLYQVRYRQYDPALGRWMQRDPLGYVDGMNLYGYYGLDPFGLSGGGWINPSDERQDLIDDISKDLPDGRHFFRERREAAQWGLEVMDEVGQALLEIAEIAALIISGNIVGSLLVKLIARYGAKLARALALLHEGADYAAHLTALVLLLGGKAALRMGPALLRFLRNLDPAKLKLLLDRLKLVAGGYYTMKEFYEYLRRLLNDEPDGPIQIISPGIPGLPGIPGPSLPLPFWIPNQDPNCSKL